MLSAWFDSDWFSVGSREFRKGPQLIFPLPAAFQQYGLPGSFTDVVTGAAQPLISGLDFLGRTFDSRRTGEVAIIRAIEPQQNPDRVELTLTGGRCRVLQ